ncbi:MAG TPA: LysM peptidoglycan-binding domain-containing protein [Anaerolineales bacterium]|nr:LysM peptidoglycan-binding domain-containing protein [Anaerolineales bacterium]
MCRSRLIIYNLILLVLLITLSCRQPVQPLSIPTIEYRNATALPTDVIPSSPVKTSYLPVVRKPNDEAIASPTPDDLRVLPGIRNDEDTYVVQMGDSLATIASLYNVTVGMLLGANEITNPDLIEIGQILVIPPPIRSAKGPGSKIIPDSELVYGPYALDFDIKGYLARFDSYLNRYSEVVEGHLRTGPEIIQMVAHDYSINPRLLVALLEYQSGWVTMANPPEDRIVYPLGNQDGWRTGLYLQLAWAADNLNRGYYLWKVDGIGGWLLSNGVAIPIDPSINAGTAGVQQLFALLDDRPNWQYDVSPEGFFKLYSDMFGYPFDYAYEPIIPEDLEQPALQLPFEPGVDWAYTGGPHGGWGEGSAWAALDFAPGYEGLGCVESYYWVVAAADGLIVRADEGRVVQDLNGDGNEGTGWTILYMHIEGNDRVQAGTYVKAGDRIGHPSCEGGYSTGTHVHLARRYNGEWIPADRHPDHGGLPFNLEGWVSSGDGIEYNGYLERDGETIAAWEGFAPGNTVHR